MLSEPPATNKVSLSTKSTFQSEISPADRVNSAYLRVGNPPCGGPIHLTFFQRSDFVCSQAQAFTDFQCNVANQFDCRLRAFLLQSIEFSG